MARELIRWGSAKGLALIEASANEGLDLLYANIGQAGKRFWEKLGFPVVHVETRSRFHGSFLAELRVQVVAHALYPDGVHNLYTMRLDLR